MSREFGDQFYDERNDFYDRNRDDYPESYGPLHKRSCTDVICLLIFLIFIGCWAAIGGWAIIHGDPNKLLVPTDSYGFRCGLDDVVKDRPFLFFFDITQCLSTSALVLGCDTRQLCVESCPTTEFYYEGQTLNTNDDVFNYCDFGYDTTATKTYNETKCPTWYLRSESIAYRCIYNVADIKRSKWKVSDSKGDEIMAFKKYINSVHMWLSLTVHNGVSIATHNENIHKFAQQIIADLVTSWWKILIGVGLALLACIIYILMLRWIAGIMVWISIAGAIAALAAGSYFSYEGWQTWKKNYEETQLSASKSKRDVLLAAFIIIVTILSIVLLVLLFLRKRIVLAISLIKEGSRAVSSVTSVLFFPIVPWLMQIGVVAYAISVGVFLATTGESQYHYSNIAEDCNSKSGWTENASCNPNEFSEQKDNYPACINATCKFSGIANEAYYPYLQGINVFGFFWLAFFVSALGQMVLAQVFAQWYWTVKKSTLPFFAITAAFYRTIRYHLGTLAFGSLIITICRIIRLGLEYIDRKLKKYDNQFTKAILCCLKCFFWCLEKFLKFINKNAYIMCAIHGKNFCTSAKDAFMLLMRNIVRVFVLDKVTDFLFFLSKLLVTSGVGAVSYIFFATDLVSFMDNSGLNYALVPVVTIMLISFLISSLFFSVYSMAVDTLFLCFLEDCEKNDGKTKPYFMSRNLMKIFGKKNKGRKHE